MDVASAARHGAGRGQPNAAGSARAIRARGLALEWWPLHAKHSRRFDMAHTLGVVMDPIAAITPYKDTSLALLLEATRRDYELFYFEMNDLFVRDGVAY